MPTTAGDPSVTDRTANIEGAATPELSQTHRTSAGGLQYDLAVPNGAYRVKLKLADNGIRGPEERAFDVFINDAQVLKHFDPAAAGAAVEVEQSFAVLVTDGNLSIRFGPEGSSPVVSAIEILPSAIVRVNCGGPTYTDSAGNVWSGDYNYSDGSAQDLTAPVTGAADPALYRTERGGGRFQYQFAVPDGDYWVVLRFAGRDDASRPRQSFTVLINGSPELMDFVPAPAGQAVLKKFAVAARDGNIEVQFDPAGGSPAVSAIAILPQIDGVAGNP